MTGARAKRIAYVIAAGIVAGWILGIAATVVALFYVVGD